MFKNFKSFWLFSGHTLGVQKNYVERRLFCHILQEKVKCQNSKGDCTPFSYILVSGAGFHRSSRRHLFWKIRKTLPKTSIVELRLSYSYRVWTHSMFSCDFSRSCFSEHLLSTISLFLFTYFLFWNLNWIMLSFSAFELGLVIILYVAVSNLVHHNFVYYITPV